MPRGRSRFRARWSSGVDRAAWAAAVGRPSEASSALAEPWTRTAPTGGGLTGSRVDGTQPRWVAGSAPMATPAVRRIGYSRDDTSRPVVHRGGFASDPALDVRRVEPRVNGRDPGPGSWSILFDAPCGRQQVGRRCSSISSRVLDGIPSVAPRETHRRRAPGTLKRVSGSSVHAASAARESPVRTASDLDGKRLGWRSGSQFRVGRWRDFTRTGSRRRLGEVWSDMRLQKAAI